MAKTLNDHGEIRLVITPTLNDIEADREYLMGKVIPHLMQQAAERDVDVVVKWNSPFGVDSLKQYQISFAVAESAHPYVFNYNPADDAQKDRHFVDGVPTYDYQTIEELGRLVEKAFVRILDRLFPHTTVTELIKALRKVARIYQEFGQLDNSLEMHERALALLQEHSDETNSDVVEQLYTCGWLNYKLGNFDKSLSLLNEAVSKARAVYGESDPHVTDFIGVIRMVEASKARK
ncbi:MAG: tetratricopeptide repeat protein [Bacteroidales bacterium]|nr:tetratricopeptide repeat protein [Candidatus Liminaster caballi]